MSSKIPRRKHEYPLYKRNIITLRLDDRELELIEEVCGLLTISKSEFIRETVITIAYYVKYIAFKENFLQARRKYYNLIQRLKRLYRILRMKLCIGVKT